MESLHNGSPQIGRYKIHELLGEGGMGKVYMAYDSQLRRIVALKVLHDGEGEEGRKQLLKEARAIAQLRDSHIVTVYEIGSAGREHYIVMEYIPGCSLAEHLKKELPPPPWSVEILCKVSLAMHHAHRQEILHRDLKPANIILTSDKEPKITDFGLARVLTTETSVSSSGLMIGTPSYMSPEQVHGDLMKIDPRSDIYGLGATLYEMLTGRPPFPGGSIVEIAMAVLRDPPVPPRRLNPIVPQEVEAICLKCLEKNPKNRYQTAYALAQDMEKYLNGRPVAAYSNGRIYRMSKWLKRKGSMPNLTMLVIGLAFGISLVLNFYFYWYLPADSAAEKVNPVLTREQAKPERNPGKKAEATGEEQSLPAGFLQTIGELVKSGAPYADVEVRFTDMKARLPYFYLLHRQWGRYCLIYAIREDSYEKYLELLNEAVRQFDMALAIHPQDHYSCFLAYMATQKCKYSGGWNHKSLAYASSLKENENQYSCYVRAEEMVNSALQLSDRKSRIRQLELALTLCDDALKYEPRFAYAFALKGKIYLKLGFFPEALANCQSALSQADDEYPAAGFLALKGDILYAQNEVQQAIEIYGHALEKSPHDYEASTGRGQCYRELRHYDLACSDFTRAIRAGGNPLECYRKRSEVYLEMGEYALALQDAETVRQLAPAIGISYRLKAEIYERQKNYEKALEEVEKGLKVAPDDSDLKKRQTIFSIYLRGQK